MRIAALALIAIMIPSPATGRTEQLANHLVLGLDNGLTPIEIGELITHLAFYTGWPNAVSACEIADRVFAKRGIAATALQLAHTALLPIPDSDAARAATVTDTVTPISPSLAQLTNGPLFQDLWRRTNLSTRDRSFVTIVALTANGDADQLGFHLTHGIENGLTRAQLGEAMAHLAFYVGWPKAFSGVAALRKLVAPAPRSHQTGVPECPSRPAGWSSCPRPSAYRLGQAQLIRTSRAMQTDRTTVRATMRSAASSGVGADVSQHDRRVGDACELSNKIATGVHAIYPDVQARDSSDPACDQTGVA